MSILKHSFPPNLSALYDQQLANQLASTQGAISALNQLHHLLHNPTLLMRPILAKEAESSAQLEGTQASIEDAYKIDVEDQSPDKRNEALEIRNYEEAMLEGVNMIKKINLNEMVVRQIQKVLTKGARGKSKHPGQYRKGDVWIGDLGTTKEEARYVAPSAAHVPALMSDLVGFIKNTQELNPLIACALIHHRFEAIHPFEDGNGRTGRLIITLFLIEKGLLTLPILYPSGYFEKNRKQYMNNLVLVDKQEEWKPWIMFFLMGMEAQASLSIKLGLEINELFKAARTKIEGEAASLNLIRVLENTFVRPYFTSPIISRELNIPRASCARYIKTLEKRSVISYVGNFKNSNVYANVRLISVLKKI